MTEVPMAGNEPNQQFPGNSGTSDWSKRGAAICAVLIIAIILIAGVFVGSFWSPYNSDGGEISYDSRSLASYNNQDISLYRSGNMYDEFSVNSSETQTTTPPDMWFNISVDSTGADAVMVSIHVAVYEIDQTTFDAIPTWSGCDAYLVEQGDYTNTVTDFFNLKNDASTYVWLVWLNASNKTVVWDVDITITLRYNGHL